MTYIKLLDKKYKLPMGDVYKDEFEEYLSNDTISIDTSNIDIKYQYTKKLFYYILNSITILGNDLEGNYKDEYMELCQKMSGIDNIQQFLYDKGKVDEALNKIEVFLVLILDFHEKLLNDEKYKGEVICL